MFRGFANQGHAPGKHRDERRKMKTIKAKLANRILGFLLLLVAASSLPTPADAQMAQWLQEEQMRQAHQRQQWMEWQRQEQFRQMADRQQLMQWQQQERLRQMQQR
jgi:hypothetical protein